jgi:hypothetical protein
VMEAAASAAAPAKSFPRSSSGGQGWSGGVREEDGGGVLMR